eukprot:TRINITY_DN9612_c0_g2_i1.p1 TRINITY_DN9612_c0_g2~~TRINITY_DN9612_c0_g2_i1.p1  ORF type:complete len:734 (-),score=123.30 TRINITY_DN9612_c0_g2_i1:8-1993(-)
MAFGFSCFKEGQVRFDAFLVCVGIAGNWIIIPIARGDAEGLKDIGLLMVLRSARLLRLARTVRLLISFRELWMLVRGLLNSAYTMVHTMLLLFVVIYVFTCIGMELITNSDLMQKSDPELVEFQEAVHRYFPGLGQTMLTLVQFVTLDNVSLIYLPLIKVDWTLALYFFAIVLVVSIVLMNLITAVIVNSALEQAMEDKDLKQSQKELHRRTLMKELRDLFNTIDVDNSGLISREEFESLNVDDMEHVMELVVAGSPSEVFDALDIDGSGDVGIDEFVEGIWQNARSTAPIEIKRMQKQLTLIRKELESNQREIGVKLESINGEFDRIRSNTAVSTPPVYELGDPKESAALMATDRMELNVQSLPPRVDTEMEADKSLNVALKLAHVTADVRDLRERLLAACNFAQANLRDIVSTECSNTDALIAEVAKEVVASCDFEDNVKADDLILRDPNRSYIDTIPTVRAKREEVRSVKRAIMKQTRAEGLAEGESLVEISVRNNHEFEEVVGQNTCPQVDRLPTVSDITTSKCVTEFPRSTSCQNMLCLPIFSRTHHEAVAKDSDNVIVSSSLVGADALTHGASGTGDAASSDATPSGRPAVGSILGGDGVGVGNASFRESLSDKGSCATITRRLLPPVQMQSIFADPQPTFEDSEDLWMSTVLPS